MSISTVLIAQTNGTPADQTPKSGDEVKAILADSFERNTFAYLPGPYHFLATFQTFAADGQPTGEGSIEKYFASPGHLKIVTQFGGHTMTTYYAGGPWVYTDDGFVGSILTYFAQDFLFNPVLVPAGLSKRDTEITAMNIQGMTLDCGSFQLEVWPQGYPPAPKETYCATRDTHDLVLRQTNHFSVRYRDFTPFLGKSIARTITASRGTQVRCRIKIEQIDQATLEDAAMTPPDGASAISPAPDVRAITPAEKTRIGGVDPPVPPGYRAAHIGTFEMFYILISREGKTIDIEPRFDLNPALEKMAADVVKTWVYKPIVRGGKPIEMITTTQVAIRY